MWHSKLIIFIFVYETPREWQLLVQTASVFKAVELMIGMNEPKSREADRGTGKLFQDNTPHPWLRHMLWLYITDSNKMNLVLFLKEYLFIFQKTFYHRCYGETVLDYTSFKRHVTIFFIFFSVS